MLPLSSDIDLYRGDGYPQRITLWSDVERTIPFNAEFYEAKMQIRRSNARGPLLLELTTDTDGGMEFVQQNPPAGPYNLLVISITPEQSNNLPPGDHVYDIQISNGVNFRRTLYAGAFRVTQDVTRP